MLIKDRMEYKTKCNPLTFTSDTLVMDAIKVMSEKNYGAVIVVNDDRTPAGIFSERDLMRRMVSKGIEADKTKLSDVMTKDVYVAKEDDNLLNWLRIMSNERFRHLPIVDKDGKVICMMSQGDFVSYTWPELMEQVKDTARATIAPNYQIAIIVLACLLYFVLVPILYHLFN